jgi:hypothetical protein
MLKLSRPWPCTFKRLIIRSKLFNFLLRVAVYEKRQNHINKDNEATGVCLKLGKTTPLKRFETNVSLFNNTLLMIRLTLYIS